MWILFSLILDLLEVKQSLSVKGFDNAQIEYTFSRVIRAFVWNIWLFIHVLVT